LSKIKKYCITILIAFFLFFPNITLANTWYFTNNNHPSAVARYLQSSFSGSNTTYSRTANFTGERIFTNGTANNRWATASFGSNVTIPAGTWTFSIRGNTTKNSWYPRIKIYNSTGTLIYTSTSPNAISGTSYMNVTWTDSVPSFSVGSGQYYLVEVYSYHTQNSNRTDRFQLNSGTNNYIIDPYYPTYYAPATRSWRFYDDHSSITPGIAYSAENISPTDMYNHNNIRLRLTITETEGGSQTGRKKLQYSTDNTNFSDVGEINSGATWAYCNGGGIDDQQISSLLLSTSNATGPYVESGTASSTYIHTAYQSAEFDYCLTENSANTNTTYYFRAYDNTSNQSISPDTGYSNPSIVISNHGLNVNIDSNFSLTPISMDDAPGPTLGNFSNLFIKDYTGTLAGWSVVATATDFSDGLGHTIPIDNLTMNTTTITPVFAETTTGINLGNGALSNTLPLNIASTGSNNGAGNFNTNGSFELYLPLATVPGDYSSTLTITIS